MIAEEKVDWNGDKLRWIEVDGCGVQVKENLFHFLETVQRVRKDSAGPHGWGRLQLDSGSTMWAIRFGSMLYASTRTT